MDTRVKDTAVVEEKELKKELKSEIHSIFLQIYFQPDFNFMCLKSFLSINPKNNDNDVVYLKSTKNNHDVSYLNYLCDLVSFPFENIIFTNSDNYNETTLWDDIVNNQDLYKQFTDIIVNSYKSQKYKHLYIRCCFHISAVIEWHNTNFIDTNGKYNYLKDYVEIEMETNEWESMYGNKSIVHASWKDFKMNNYIQDNDKVKAGANILKYFGVCKGFLCKNRKDLMESYDYFVKKYNISTVVIKPCESMGGYGICYISSKEELKSYIKQLSEKQLSNLVQYGTNMEENLKKTINGENYYFISVGYNHHNFAGKFTISPVIMLLFDKQSGICLGSQSFPWTDESDKSDEKESNDKNNNDNLYDDFIEKLQTNVELLCKNELKPKTQGGFDFYVENNKNWNNIKMENVYLLDVNTCRALGETPYFNFIGNNKDYAKLKFRMIEYENAKKNNKIVADALFLQLSKNGVLFDKKTGHGTIPVVLTYFHNSLQFLILANDIEQVEVYQSKLYDVFKYINDHHQANIIVREKCFG